MEVLQTKVRFIFYNLLSSLLVHVFYLSLFLSFFATLRCYTLYKDKRQISQETGIKEEQHTTANTFGLRFDDYEVIYRMFVYIFNL